MLVLVNLPCYCSGTNLGRYTKGAIHSTKISGKFGPKLNGSVRSDRKSFEITGPPFEEDHFSRSDRLEFWLNGSRPNITDTGKMFNPRARKKTNTLASLLLYPLHLGKRLMLRNVFR